MTRTLLLLSLAVILAVRADAGAQQMDAFELTIPELQDAMVSGNTTSAALVQQYLDRIAAFDNDGPQLKAMITINPRTGFQPMRHSKIPPRSFNHQRLKRM